MTLLRHSANHKCITLAEWQLWSSKRVKKVRGRNDPIAAFLLLLYIRLRKSR